MPKNFNNHTGHYNYTVNLIRAEDARKSEEHRNKHKRIRQRLLDGYFLGVATKEEKFHSLSNIKQIGNQQLSQPEKIARSKRKKEGRGAVIAAHSTPLVLPLVAVLLLFVPGVETVSATSVLQLLTLVAATSARNRALSSDSTPQYSVDSLTANCATGAMWTLTRPNPGTEHILAGVTTLYGLSTKYPRVYVSAVSASTQSSNLLGINAKTGKTAITATRKPEDEFHDGRLAATSIVTANPHYLNEIVIGTVQPNSGLLDSKVCDNITQTPPPEKNSYASTYDMSVMDFPQAIPPKPVVLTEVASSMVLAPQSIPQEGEIDVTPQKTSLSIYLNATVASRPARAETGMIKITSTATKKDLCTIYTMGDGAAPIDTQLAVYQYNSSMPKQMRMPEDARALFVNAGQVNDYLSIRSLQGTQDLLIAGRDLDGAERLLVIKDFDQIEGEVDCAELVTQPTGWQEIRIQGQRKGIFNFFDRRTALLAATPLVGGEPNLFLSTIDNPNAPLWKINLDLFSGQIVLGENHTITMPIQVPVFYNTTAAVTVHQTISLSQSSTVPEQQILVVGQTYVYDEGTPVDARVLDTLTAFNATTGMPLFVITGGMDTAGMGMNHQMTAYDALLVAQMSGQAGIITLNLPGLQTGTTPAYFTPGTHQDYTLQCRLPPSPGPSPGPTPTPKWSPPPTPQPHYNYVGLSLALGISAGLVISGYCTFRLCNRRRNEEQAPLLPQQAQPPRPANQPSPNPSFFATPVAPVSVPEVSESLNQQRYDRLHGELEQLKQELEPYDQHSEVSRVLRKIEQLLSQKVNSTYECKILHCIMDEPAYIHIKGQKHFLAERKALEKHVQLNKTDLSGNDVSALRNVPIETNIPVKSMINEWLDNLGKEVAKLQEESATILASLSGSNTPSSSRGMKHR